MSNILMIEVVGRSRMIAEGAEFEVGTVGEEESDGK